MRHCANERARPSRGPLADAALDGGASTRARGPRSQAAFQSGRCPLPTGASRRAHPLGHQEAGSDCARRAPHHRRPPGHTRRRRLGVRPRRHRRRIADRLRRGPGRRERHHLRGIPAPSASPSIGDWESLPGSCSPITEPVTRSHVFELRLPREQVQHLRTRPYRPCTNGKAERVIQTLLREWAYARAVSPLAGTHQSPAHLAHLLQSLATAWQPRRQHATLSAGHDGEQRVWKLQLAVGRGPAAE